MPASRAVLADVESLGLDPSVPHSRIGAGGTIKVISQPSAEEIAEVVVEQLETLPAEVKEVSVEISVPELAESMNEPESSEPAVQEDKPEESEKKRRGRRSAKTVTEPSS